jgi:hypothetical protein
MKNAVEKRRLIIASCSVSALALLAFGGLNYERLQAARDGTRRVKPSDLPTVRSHPAIAHDLPALPLSFSPNEGQTAPAVRFVSHFSGGTLYFTSSGVALAVQQPNQDDAGPRKVSLNTHSAQPQPAMVKVRFVGANPQATISAGKQLPGKANYFLGNDRTRWRADLPTYSNITYQDLYPGVQLRYDGAVGQVKGTYSIAPGADASRICWRYESAGKTSIDRLGNLHFALTGMNTGTSELLEHAPVAWQEIDGQRVSVSAQYSLGEDNNVTIALGPYDRAYPLVIDPTLTYSTYLGGSGGEVAYGMTVDANGNVYLTGGTLSANFPTVNPVQADFAGSADVFVAKIDPTGSTLLYSTYLGGSRDDSGTSIKVDDDGNAYISGYTSSSNFPTRNPIQPSNGTVSGVSFYDGFVAKLNPTGNALVYSTYLGGAVDDSGVALAIDTSGNAYVTGYTNSPNFPTANGIPLVPGGSYDAFVAKINPTGTALVYSTLLGGASDDIGSDITVDGSDNAYVIGYTLSPNFPTTNPIQAMNAGSADAFVTKLDSNGIGLVYSTYLGGSGYDSGNAITLDASGNAYLVGYTNSTNFPTANPLQPQNAGSDDAFVAKLSATGSTLLYSTYLGGSSADEGYVIALDGAGNIYVGGNASSEDFPIENAVQSTHVALSDVFLTKLNPAGGALLYSTFLGGNNNDICYGIGVDAQGNAYIGGYTFSTDFPTANALQPNMNGTYDAFIARISPSPVTLLGVVSRKVHGDAGTFDLDLPLTGSPGIECRSGGANGDHTLVFSFRNTLNGVNSITATATTSSETVPVTVLNTSGIGADTHEYIANLSGVPNASHVTVTLIGVTDSANATGDISAHMDVLLGDVNASARTDSGDVTTVRNNTVAVPDQQTFQFDVNTSGRIDSGDVTVTRNGSVTVLP